MADTPDYVNGEPEPVHNFNPSVHDLLVNDAKHTSLGFSRAGLSDLIKAEMVDLFRERKRYGLNKYGTVLQAENGRDFLKDALDEIVDLLAYVRQGLEEFPDSRDLREGYHLSICALGSLLKVRADRAKAESFKSRVKEVTEDFRGGRTDATVLYDANGPSRKVRCNCESGAECGGTGWKDA